MQGDFIGNILIIKTPIDAKRKINYIHWIIRCCEMVAIDNAAEKVADFEEKIDTLHFDGDVGIKIEIVAV